MLERRYLYYWGDCYYGNCNSAWYIWGRWVLLGVVVAFVLILGLFTRFYSARRVRMGGSALPGTAWMVPPSYYHSQQQYHNPINPAPVYNSEVGQQDAGYYDQNGNFISKYDEASFPQAHVRHDNSEPVSGFYQPPTGPPPGHADSVPPPSGPPPGHADYCRPPETPPPAK